MKAQRQPSPWAYVSPAAVSQTDAACGGGMGRRVVLAYKALGYRVDDHLGWMTLSDGLAYSVRERSPWKETFDSASLDSITRITKLAEQYGERMPAAVAERGKTDGDHAANAGRGGERRGIGGWLEHRCRLAAAIAQRSADKIKQRHREPP